MSSFLVAAPEAFSTASADLSAIGESIREATTAAAPSTTAIAPAAFDEVSAAITQLFGSYGQEFQALSGQAAAFHGQFVQLLSSGGAAYAGAEATNTTAAATGALQSMAASDPLTTLVGLAQPLGVFSPVKDLTRRPLF